MPAAMASRGTREPARIAAQLDGHRLARDSEQAAQHRPGAAAEEPGKADHLAGMQADGRVAVGLRLQQQRVGRRRRSGDLFGRAPGHRGDEIVHGERAARAHGRDAAVAQHGAAVGDGDHLVETMGDVDHGGAVCLHAGEHRKQPLDLALFERRRGLVENEDTALPAQRLGDRHQLALGEAERGDGPVGIGVEVELSEHGARGRAHACAIDHGERAEPSHRKVAERDVFRDRQRRHQAQLLRDGHDARRNRVARTGKMPLLAIDSHHAAIGTENPAQDADQRGLAGAVLADNGVDLAESDVEVDAVERRRRAELL